MTSTGRTGEVPADALLRQVLGGLDDRAHAEITEMIEAQRIYDLNLRALRMQDEILGRAVNDVGRPTA